MYLSEVKHAISASTVEVSRTFFITNKFLLLPGLKLLKELMIPTFLRRYSS